MVHQASGGEVPTPKEVRCKIGELFTWIIYLSLEQLFRCQGSGESMRTTLEVLSIIWTRLNTECWEQIKVNIYLLDIWGNKYFLYIIKYFVRPPVRRQARVRYLRPAAPGGAVQPRPEDPLRPQLRREVVSSDPRLHRGQVVFALSIVSSRVTMN